MSALDAALGRVPAAERARRCRVIRRGLVGLAVVVGGARPANDVAEEQGDEGGVVVGHAIERGPSRSLRHPLRPGIKSTARADVLGEDAALNARLRVDGHTCDSLASALGCARSLAADLLAGRRRWTDHQRSKLARGAA